MRFIYPLIRVFILSSELEKKKSEGRDEQPVKKERVIEEWEKGRVILSSNQYNTVEVTVNVKVLIKVRRNSNCPSKYYYSAHYLLLFFALRAIKF